MAFISIANAQEVHTVSNKGTKNTLYNSTTAELYTTGSLVTSFTITRNWNNGGGVRSNQGTIIKFDTQGIVDSDYFANTAAAPFIQVINSGTYKVSYRVSAQLSSGGTPSGTEYILFRNGAYVPGSYSAAYHEGTTSLDTANASRILVLTANDELQVIGCRYAGTSTVRTVVNGSSLLVERIR